MSLHQDHPVSGWSPRPQPRDKAKVEVGVQVVQRWILARLRNPRFFSLAELNQAIRELVDQLNDRAIPGRLKAHVTADAVGSTWAAQGHLAHESVEAIME